MDKSQYISALQRLVVFSKLSLDEISVLLDYAEMSHLSKGEVLVNENMAGDTSYFICKGSVERRFHENDGTSYDHFGAGVLVGEMAMLTEHIYSATVSAISDLTVLTFKRDNIYQLFADHEVIGDIFLETIRARLAILAEMEPDNLLENDPKTLEGLLPHNAGSPYLN